MGDRKYPVFKEVPVIEGAVNHPDGYRWISNRKSRFTEEYEKALVPENVAHKWRREHA